MPLSDPFSLSSSIRSKTHSRTDSQVESRDTYSATDYFAENLLEDDDPSVPLSKPQVSQAVRLVDRPRPTHSIRADTNNTRLVIAVDYGTTFTGIALALTTTDSADLSEIEVISDWGRAMKVTHKAPSVISYSLPQDGERQWGADVSINAITMVNTKLELDVQATKLDELELTQQFLEGIGYLTFKHTKQANGRPEYESKSPKEIVADYLTRVFEEVWNTIEKRYHYAGARRPSVDLVMTVPVKWSYEACDATFQALKQAGLNRGRLPTLSDMIVLSEAEAASHFAVRHLQDIGADFLKLNEPFILCDAGGGTVDLVAYQVKQLQPHLELSQVSLPTSDKCGAAFVDFFFKRWLRKTIGSDRYRELDPTSSGQRTSMPSAESGKMRELMKQFEEKKKTFSNSTFSVKLDLPGTLGTLTMPGIVDGGITLHSNDMKDIFNHCVGRIISLIEAQRRQVERQTRRKVKNVLLVGGFGESPYLREELEKSLTLRKIQLRRPAPMASWTAVVQGAVVYGIEKARQNGVKRIFTSKRSYGIVVDEPASCMFDSEDQYHDPVTNKAYSRGQFTWFIRKGDLIFSTEPKHAEKTFTRVFTLSDTRRFDLPLFAYFDEDDEVPQRWAVGEHDVSKVGIVRCDLSNVQKGVLPERRNYETGERYAIAHLTCKAQISLTTLAVEVYLKDGIRVGQCAVAIEDPKNRRTSVDSTDSY